MRRIPELDALRGLAAVAIVLYHLWFPGVTLAGTAVDLFFVMSGYLISTIILRGLDRPNFLRTFYARRALRIWPAYYLALLATVAACSRLSPPGPIEGLPYYLLYIQRIQNYWFAAEPPFFEGFRHTWTLAIEEQFYLAWPLLLVVGGRRSLAPLSLGLAAVAVVARASGFSTWVLLTRCDGLALGGLLAAMLIGEPDPRRDGRRLATALGLAVLVRLVGTFKPGGMPESVGLSLRMFSVNLGYFALVGLVARRTGAAWLAPLRARPLIALGTISYGIYLYHYIIFHLFDRLGLGGGLAADLLKLGASFAVAGLSWRLVEAPILRLKDRVGYGRATGSARAPAAVATAG